ncbi:MAG: antibiotic biosynthesis monooxygenase [Nitrososphaeraceae archaeon]|nr:antibiotic biosynthesis monooxygenase [Nitrososphaeraceae archaeon]
MIKLIEMDERVKYSKQMEENDAPVILVNKFNVNPEEVDQFLKAWAADAEIMKRQPGCISAQLHQGIAGSCVFVNYAVWESTEKYKQAYNNPEFQSLMAAYPPSTKSSPHLFKKIAPAGDLS